MSIALQASTSHAQDVWADVKKREAEAQQKAEREAELERRDYRERMRHPEYYDLSTRDNDGWPIDPKDRAREQKWAEIEFSNRLLSGGFYYGPSVNAVLERVREDARIAADERYQQREREDRERAREIESLTPKGDLVPIEQVRRDAGRALYLLAVGQENSNNVQLLLSRSSYLGGDTYPSRGINPRFKVSSVISDDRFFDTANSKTVSLDHYTGKSVEEFATANGMRDLLETTPTGSVRFPPEKIGSLLMRAATREKLSSQETAILKFISGRIGRGGESRAYGLLMAYSISHDVDLQLVGAMLRNLTMKELKSVALSALAARQDRGLEADKMIKAAPSKAALERALMEISERWPILLTPRDLAEAAVQSPDVAENRRQGLLKELQPIYEMLRAYRTGLGGYGPRQERYRTAFERLMGQLAQYKSQPARRGGSCQGFFAR